ncbi:MULTISPECIES: class I SAM-dependent methyltransferase [Acidiphilium]|uniref:O-Methyltransferase involved in polyketide biosynthesis n=1 Tax=Acidiphilium rubrum TaxID=526 RepID=A0A8G2CKU6_ACIRU|nr:MULTISPECIES: class I SAM-dependent methyltransferase [Acidiphilium]SIQ85138.1 O-Methyltransferase involved in polyketide biosynthesis [Acidiphilium rubrum]
MSAATRHAPGLNDVPETMLWSLYHRATEARRADRVLADPDSVRIMEGLDYDFPGHFGVPGGALAGRAAQIDRCVVQWLEAHPDGLVVSLGEGLETQSRRVDNGRMRWLSVDLPEAIRLRELFLPPTERFRHLAMNALDPGWIAAVDTTGPVFVVAQGLLMYLEPEAVGRLFGAMAAGLAGAGLMFDTIPPWLSRLTLRGLHQTMAYRLPGMPWGIARDDIEPTMRRWCAAIGPIVMQPYRMPRGMPPGLDEFVTAAPFLRNQLPCLVQTRFL